jgi:hypothetical protein
MMNSELKKRLLQLHTQSEAGMFGSKAQAAASEYKNLQDKGMQVFLKLVEDFYSVPKETEEDQMIANLSDLFCQLIIVVYREAKKQDEEIALAFANSFIKDFPNVQGSCLYSQWEALAKASFAFKSSAPNSLLIWQQSLKLTQAYNEFLNALLGYFLIAWRCALGKSYPVNVLNNTFGSKLNEFSQLTGGDDGAFYLIFRLANPNLRNAIAHEDIWLDSETDIVKYSAGKGLKETYEMNLVEFMGLATVGSHLGQAYIVAIATIIILEDGSQQDIMQLPKHLIKVFTKAT